MTIIKLNININFFFFFFFTSQINNKYYLNYENHNDDFTYLSKITQNN